MASEDMFEALAREVTSHCGRLTFAGVGIVVLRMGYEGFERKLPFSAGSVCVLVDGDALGGKSNGYV